MVSTLVRGFKTAARDPTFQRRSAELGLGRMYRVVRDSNMLKLLAAWALSLRVTAGHGRWPLRLVGSRTAGLDIQKVTD